MVILDPSLTPENRWDAPPLSAGCSVPRPLALPSGFHPTSGQGQPEALQHTRWQHAAQGARISAHEGVAWQPGEGSADGDRGGD